MAIDVGQLLAVFLEDPAGYVSGEQLSKRFGCSRTAVWKQVQALQQQGYRFEAVPRRGYRLLQAPPRLDIARLQRELGTREFGRSVKYAESLDSTQSEAHRLVARGEAKHGLLIVAEEQTSGRGRMGRSWHSPSGLGIWMSLVLYPQLPPQLVPQLTLLTAVALCRTIRKLFGLQAGIKWPNDLLIGGKKISGILLESVAEDARTRYVVAGVGISANLLREDYPPELLAKASSLAIELGRPVDREQLLAAFLTDFESLYRLYLQEGFAPVKTLWEALNVTLGHSIAVALPEGTLAGQAEAIDDFGALAIRTENGTLRRIYSGDT